jgi:hypothetical protein
MYTGPDARGGSVAEVYSMSRPPIVMTFTRYMISIMLVARLTDHTAARSAASTPDRPARRISRQRCNAVRLAVGEIRLTVRYAIRPRPSPYKRSDCRALRQAG